MATVFMLIIAFFALWLFFKIFSKSAKLIFKILLNSLLGFVILFIVNFFGDLVGIHISVNFLSSLITGVFGIPGIILLLLIETFIV